MQLPNRSLRRTAARSLLSSLPVPHLDLEQAAHRLADSDPLQAFPEHRVANTPTTMTTSPDRSLPLQVAFACSLAAENDRLLIGMPRRTSSQSRGSRRTSGGSIRRWLGSALGKADDLLGSSPVIAGRNLARTVMNHVGLGNPKSRPMFRGERHLLEGPGSRYPGSNYNYAGPGTHLAERDARGDPPINDVDEVAYEHDHLYGDAKTAQDVRRAD